MFTYLDPTVKKRLIEQGKLVCVRSDGSPVAAVESPPDDARAISVLGPIPMPIDCAGIERVIEWYASVRHTRLSLVEDMAERCREDRKLEAFAGLSASMAVNSVLLIGDPKTWDNPLVRIHSCCLTGDVFGSKRCECGPQFKMALERIVNDPAGGMLIYMSGHEGRGIGLWAKAATYLLQDSGENTYQANRSLGLPDDSRDFGDAATLLKYFHGNRPFRLLTNNPKKINDLQASGLEHITPAKHVTGISHCNQGYLAAKRDWGHTIDGEDLRPLEPGGKME
jgi:GTP cyclohydrolase II